MSSVRNKDTGIETALRSALHRRGARFRKHVSSLPGTPDIVFMSARVAVFVDGDFWHGFRFPQWASSLSPFWEVKILKNRQRDKRNHRRLRRMGWVVVRVWQHQIENDLESCVSRVLSTVKGRKEQKS